ncbi:hypothetical protein, partial [Xanthomonas campestris]|uniref:hypothetical protein n=1 Tax=Xanthomonas campestris TaxID=339 RepID=UPI002B227292
RRSALARDEALPTEPHRAQARPYDKRVRMTHACKTTHLLKTHSGKPLKSGHLPQRPTLAPAMLCTLV